MPSANFQIDTFATGAVINNLHDLCALANPNIPYSVADLQIQNLGPGIVTIGIKNAAGNALAEVERRLLPNDVYPLNTNSNSISLKERWLDTSADDTDIYVSANPH
jgi:hypothetical protein